MSTRPVWANGKSSAVSLGLSITRVNGLDFEGKKDLCKKTPPPHHIVSICLLPFISLLDINECEESTSGCDQLCENTAGGFTCTCRAGYTRMGNTCVQGSTFLRPCYSSLINNFNGVCNFKLGEAFIFYIQSGFVIQVPMYKHTLNFF